MTYGTDRLYEELSYVALHFHWSRDELLDLEHHERLRYVATIRQLTADDTAGR
ncbi:hypothetical protein DEU38_12316 [Rhodococcus sp. AG1013]|uniref:DUF6760 family protein n=1 Tax=Rhodococcus sp. AG1013 TaxID=2183996 RepID=UPI000E2B8673|nr:DUF6760 family protein [Rhodococcus sp. AG1013]RDI17181.1 hypothetical protein DEU38_12316 [Rhodococcus sp. AG1013]